MKINTEAFVITLLTSASSVYSSRPLEWREDGRLHVNRWPNGSVTLSITNGKSLHGRSFLDRILFDPIKRITLPHHQPWSRLQRWQKKSARLREAQRLLYELQRVPFGDGMAFCGKLQRINWLIHKVDHGADSVYHPGCGRFGMKDILLPTNRHGERHLRAAYDASYLDDSPHYQGQGGYQLDQPSDYNDHPHYYYYGHQHRHHRIPYSASSYKSFPHLRTGAERTRGIFGFGGTSETHTYDAHGNLVVTKRKGGFLGIGGKTSTKVIGPHGEYKAKEKHGLFGSSKKSSFKDRYGNKTKLKHKKGAWGRTKVTLKQKDQYGRRVKMTSRGGYHNQHGMMMKRPHYHYRGAAELTIRPSRYRHYRHHHHHRLPFHRSGGITNISMSPALYGRMEAHHMRHQTPLNKQLTIIRPLNGHHGHQDYCSKLKIHSPYGKKLFKMLKSHKISHCLPDQIRNSHGCHYAHVIHHPYGKSLKVAKKSHLQKDHKRRLTVKWHKIRHPHKGYCVQITRRREIITQHEVLHQHHH